MSDETTIDTRGLDQLLKSLKKKAPTGRIGIIGAKASASHGVDGPNNATIGSAHEFGTSILPQRSFLRMPISDLLGKRMESSNALDKDVLREVIKDGSVLPWLKKIIILAEGIVIEAFDSGGFGKWKPSIMDHKKIKQTLVETQQLRNSITSEVIE